ncbi:MAG: DUF1294 domain-containing protein [Clostridia bacterium]
MDILIIYIILINLIAFVIMGIDKGKAKARKRRISEDSMFIAALLGGALGAKLGMSLFNHKTKHKKFIIGIPIIIIMNFSLFFYIFKFVLL